ncbi:MAG: hypothetical protein LBH74_03935 [Nitrososphaerota archaeon]|jgi:hypothetical protein|uniref:dockerin type I domain-containing protein n=1 Tax=Candidatus Bathycorpusculum sp. TaxID=2994959 RepID=UPI0028304720|nr:hypothetical protein [Candidatus Termitimicrobium sp.]MCL2432163.1 hypothetical protein [Candidatus Termitimicrobium sp.]MDR0492774.1 hypothetical protein [Nitrososphaerota archaeon]
MKPLKFYATITLLILVGLSGWQCQIVDAASVYIAHTTTLNPWGNESGLVYRGHPAAVNITLTSLSKSNVQIYITLMDTNNVAVAIANTTTTITEQTTITVDMVVASYAFAGHAQYNIVVTDLTSKLLATLILPTYISVLGDFDSDGKVTPKDFQIFIDAFDYFGQYQEIPHQNKICDLNNDKKIDFTDLAYFVGSYIDEGNSPPSLLNNQTGNSNSTNPTA